MKIPTPVRLYCVLILRVAWWTFRRAIVWNLSCFSKCIFSTFLVLCQYIKRTYITYIRQMINRVFILGLFFLSCNQCISAELDVVFNTTCPNVQMFNCPNGTGFYRMTTSPECSCIECPPTTCSSEGTCGPCIPCTIPLGLILLTTCTNVQMLSCSFGFGFYSSTKNPLCSCLRCPLTLCSHESGLGRCFPCTMPLTTKPQISNTTAPPAPVQTPSPAYSPPQ